MEEKEDVGDRAGASVCVRVCAQTNGPGPKGLGDATMDCFKNSECLYDRSARSWRQGRHSSVH